MKQVVELRSGGTIIYTLITGRCLMVEVKGSLQYSKLEGKILSVIVNGEYVFGLKDTINLKFEALSTKFFVDNIGISEDGCIIVTCKERTKASYFIMPMLGYGASYYLWGSAFINCMANIKNTTAHLLYRFMPTAEYLKFENYITKHPLYIKRQDSGAFVSFEFKIPEHHHEDFKYFIDGKYSAFDNNYKKNILKFHKLERDGELGQILYRDTRRKIRMEFDLDCSIPNGLDLLSKPEVTEFIN